MRPKKAPRLHEPPHQFPLSLSVCTVVWKAITEPFLFFAGGNTEARGTNCKGTQETHFGAGLRWKMRWDVQMCERRCCFIKTLSWVLKYWASESLLRLFGLSFTENISGWQRKSCTKLIAEIWECSSIAKEKSDQTGWKQTSRLNKLLRKRKWRWTVKCLPKPSVVNIHHRPTSCFTLTDCTYMASACFMTVSGHNQTVTVKKNSNVWPGSALTSLSRSFSRKCRATWLGRMFLSMFSLCSRSSFISLISSLAWTRHKKSSRAVYSS